MIAIAIPVLVTIGVIFALVHQTEKQRRRISTLEAELKHAHEVREACQRLADRNRRCRVKAGHDARVIAMMAPKQLKQLAQFCEAVAKYTREASR